MNKSAEAQGQIPEGIVQYGHSVLERIPIFRYLLAVKHWGWYREQIGLEVDVAPQDLSAFRVRRDMVELPKFHELLAEARVEEQQEIARIAATEPVSPKSVSKPDEDLTSRRQKKHFH